MDQTSSILHLDTLRTKLSMLLDSLNTILAAPPHSDWSTLLEQFNSLLPRFASIQAELDLATLTMRPPQANPNDVTSGTTMADCVVHPHLLIKQNPEFIPHILLRTKLIPEIDDEIGKTLQMANELQQTVAGDGVIDLEHSVERRQEFVQSLIELFTDVQSELDPLLKTKLRPIPTNESTTDSKHLECCLKWMSSGQ